MNEQPPIRRRVDAAAGLPRCPACRESKYWIDERGLAICSVCHPPAPGVKIADSFGEGGRGDDSCEEKGG